MTTKILKLRRRARRASRSVTRAATPARPPVLTRAETAECTCPDACERDHEHD